MLAKLPYSTIACLLLGLGVAQAEPPEWSGNPDRTFVIKTMPGMMRYDVTEIPAEPGEKIKIELKNPDDLQHNLLFLDADGDDKDGQKFAQEIWALGDKGISMGWVPEGDDRVLVASRLLDPEAEEDLYLIAPEKTGDYPYICSVPGHSLLMKGILKVRNKELYLSDVTANIYVGKWKKLPDFSALKPKGTVKLENRLIDLKPAAALPAGFGMTFDATLEIKKTGDYEFELTSDDGSRLIVDGEGEIENNGIHPMQTKKKKLKLEKGTHSIRLLYFDGGGTRGLALAMKPKKEDAIPLSVQVYGNSKKQPKKAPDPIPLTSAKPGEAVMYRNFIEGASPRAIGVGYPGEVNICWDANTMGLAMVWRGAFMDASRHWTSRGQGNQQPGGFDVVKTGAGFPLQTLESLDEVWISDSPATIKYERDNPDTEREITYHKPNTEFRFKGYRLDKKRFPTFRYSWKELDVEESFAPGVKDGRKTIERVIKLSGSPGENVYFRLADTGSLKLVDGWYSIGDLMQIKVKRAEPIIRLVKDQKELLVPISNTTKELHVSYHWKKAISGAK